MDANMGTLADRSAALRQAYLHSIQFSTARSSAGHSMTGLRIDWRWVLAIFLALCAGAVALGYYLARYT